jgi:putative membrane protein
MNGVNRRHRDTARVGIPIGCGVAVVLVATAPALHEAAHTSFAWHMVQHLLLILVAGPLLAVGASSRLAERGSRALPRSTWPPAVAATSVVYLVTIILWHVPGLYDAAMTSVPLHAMEHVSLLAASSLMWMAVALASRQGAHVSAVVALAGSAVTGAALGLVLLGAPVSLYVAHGGDGALWNQQVGGALMKVSSLFVHAGAAVWIAIRWVASVDVRRGDASRAVSMDRASVPGQDPARQDPGRFRVTP